MERSWECPGRAGIPIPREFLAVVWVARWGQAQDGLDGPGEAFPTSAIPDLSMAVRTQHLWENSSLEQHLEASWALGCPNCPSLLRWENLGAGSWLKPPQWGWRSLDFVTETRLEGPHGRCHRASGSRRGAGNRSAPDFGKEKFLLGGTQEERWE